MWRHESNGFLAKVDFPPYTLQMLTSRHILVGGGGGPSNTGISNGFEVFELFHNGNKFIAEKNISYDTGPNVVMNSATYNDGLKIWLAVGQESCCQIYNVQAKVVKVVNGRTGSNNFKQDIRKRRKNPNKTSNLVEVDAKSEERYQNIQLLFKPFHSTQTDFGKLNLQRVVKISPNGKIMATGGTDGYIRLWNFPQVTALQELSHFSTSNTSEKLRDIDKEINDIDFCFQSKKLATIARDSKVIIWDIFSALKLIELFWNPSKNEKCIFKRCRFCKPLDCIQNPQQLVTLSNSLSINQKIKNKVQNAYLQLWNIDSGSILKVIKYNESLSELTLSDDGKFLAIGTMFSGTVDIFITFNLKKILHVPNAHNMFITSLIFLPKEEDRLSILDGPAITSNTEAAVISCSIDNKICIHSIPYRRSLPVWLFLILLVSCISAAFIMCSYLGL